MKKKFIFICSLFLMLSFFFLASTKALAFDKEKGKIEVLDATYEATSNVFTKDLGYGITHIKDIAQSSAGRLNNYASCGPKDELVGQSVNVLDIKSSEAVRIVNWTYILNGGWTKQTVKSLAKNFELHNPGWKVIAAVNGDFFDINGKFALPYQGNGVHVSNGEVYRPIGNNSNVGFKNDGSNYSLVGGQGITTGDVTLAIYDGDTIVKEFKVDKINESPVDNEIGVWYTYNVMQKVSDGSGEYNTRVEVPISISSENTYIVKAPYRCLPISEKQIYGKGSVTKNDSEVTLKLGQFAIETANEEVVNYLTDNTTIRVQYNIEGKFKDCDNITGAGAKLLEDGKPYEEAGGLDRHPRTCVGIKADGSIVLMTVDGRQFDADMYGMTYAELSATLLYYGCVEAYNLDGGGSTTCITRNEYDEFDVWNSPSDGSERDDSNALLVVVPTTSLKINEVESNMASFDYATCKDANVENLKILLNGKECKYDLNNNLLTIDNLTEQTKYTLTYTYDITYKNTTLKDCSSSVIFTTGKTSPSVYGCYIDETSTDYVLHFNILDPKNTISLCYIKFDKSIKTIIDRSITEMTFPKDSINDPSTFKIIYKYNIQSSPNKNLQKEIPFKAPTSYTINYELNGGTLSTPNPTTYSIKDVILSFNAPTKKGYDFIGWFTEDDTLITELIDDNLGNITLYAKYTESTYSINYILNGGKANVELITSYSLSNLPGALPSLEKLGYTFLGWYTEEENGTLVNSIDNIDLESITLYARFSVNTYTITYILNDGTASNPEVFTIESLPLTLNDATRDGYKFIGWYLDGKEISSIDENNLRNITLTAMFEKLEAPKKGCSCKKDVMVVVMLLIASTSLCIILRKKH